MERSDKESIDSKFISFQIVSTSRNKDIYYRGFRGNIQISSINGLIENDFIQPWVQETLLIEISCDEIHSGTIHHEMAAERTKYLQINIIIKNKQQPVVALVPWYLHGPNAISNINPLFTYLHIPIIPYPPLSNN